MKKKKQLQFHKQPLVPVPRSALAWTYVKLCGEPKQGRDWLNYYYYYIGFACELFFIGLFCDASCAGKQDVCRDENMLAV